MKLDQLIAFTAVAEEGHFRRAAEKLGVPQPTLSTRISALEERVGFLLFDRKNNGAFLTIEGHRFKHHAEIAISAMNAAQRSGRLPRDVTRVLSLGLPAYHADAIGKFIVDNVPDDVGLRIEADYSERLFARTAAGLLDASLILIPRISSDLDVELIGTEELVLVATPDCAEDEEKLWKSFIQVQWGHNFFDFQARALGTQEIPRRSIDIPSLALRIILSSGGAAWQPRRQVARELADGALVALDDYGTYDHPIYLVHRKSGAIAILAELKDLFARYFGH